MSTITEKQKEFQALVIDIRDAEKEGSVTNVMVAKALALAAELGQGGGNGDGGTTVTPAENPLPVITLEEMEGMTMQDAMKAIRPDLGKVAGWGNAFEVKKNGMAVGMLVMLSDDGMKMATQVFISHYVIPNEGGALGTVDDTRVTAMARTMGLLPGGTYKEGEWSPWRNMLPDGISKAVEIEAVTPGVVYLPVKPGKYFRFEDKVEGLLDIVLPGEIAELGEKEALALELYFTTGESPSVTFSCSKEIDYYSGFSIEPDTTYEINAMWNGKKWVIAYATVE